MCRSTAVRFLDAFMFFLEQTLRVYSTTSISKFGDGLPKNDSSSEVCFSERVEFQQQYVQLLIV